MNVTPRKWYVVTTDSECVVTDANGKVLCTATAGEQKLFYATTPVVTLSDETATVGEANFKPAAFELGLLGGGTNGLPAGYTRVEYIEQSRATPATSWRTPYVATPFAIENDDIIEVDYTLRSNDFGRANVMMACSPTGKVPDTANIDNSYTSRLNVTAWWVNDSIVNWGLPAGSNNKTDLKNEGAKQGKRYVLVFQRGQISINGSLFEYEAGDIPADNTYHLAVGISMGMYNSTNNLHGAKITRRGKLLSELVPAVDPIGNPCMYDLAARLPLYNMSPTGEFSYPGKETEATTYSLRRPRMYAQMTPHGLRRLYHVPKGCTLSKEEYAEQNGFKLLVETPAPVEGDWEPVWQVREDCIERVWVETVPPAEELLTEA